MSDRCPPLVDLLGGDEDARRHAGHCPRCRVLLHEGAANDAFPAVSVYHPASATPSRRTVDRPPAEAGQVWAITAADSDFREVVLVLSRQGDRVRVAASSADPALRQLPDVFSDSEALGYERFFVSRIVGTLTADRLRAYLARVPEGLVTRVEDAFSSLPPSKEVDSAAAIRLTMEELVERFRALPGFEPDATRSAEVRGAISLGMTLRDALEGPEWDLPSLAEAAAATEGEVRLVRDDALDLTDRSDISLVSRLIHVLDLANPLDLVKASLQRSAGGLRFGLEGGGSLAGRSRAHVSDEQRNRDLLADQSEIDSSDTGRTRAIATYLRDLEAELDDL